MRWVAVLAVVLLGLAMGIGAAGSGSEPARARPAEAAEPFVALMGVWGKPTSRLGWLDPLSLRPVAGRTPVAVGLHDLPQAFSAGGDRLALGSGRTDSVVMVDLARLRILWRRTTGPPAAIAWPAPGRLIVLADGHRGGGARYRELFVLDAAIGSVLSERSLDPSPGLFGAAQTPRGLVLLLAPSTAIGAAELDVIDATGSVRSVSLPDVAAGAIYPDPGETPPRVVRYQHPGLAVDAAGEHAFVVPAQGPLVEVDLATLAVSEHALSRPASLLGRIAGWLTPSAYADGGAIAAGSERQALWLANGTIAVTGYDEKLAGPDGATSISTAAGLSLIDPRDWTVRAVDEHAHWLTTASGVIVTYAYPQDRGSPPVWQLTAYTPGGQRLFRRPLTHAQNVYVAGGYAYIGTGIEYKHHSVQVIDLHTGRTVRRAHAPGSFSPIRPDAPEACWC
jgi:hypothetical protein